MLAVASQLLKKTLSGKELNFREILINIAESFNLNIMQIVLKSQGFLVIKYKNKQNLQLSNSEMNVDLERHVSNFLYFSVQIWSKRYFSPDITEIAHLSCL